MASKLLPARQIKSSSFKNICKFPSPKYGGMIICESLMECHYCGLIEIDNRVKFYCPQPFRVEFFIKEQKYHYTPDFYLQTVDGHIIVEVKPKDKAELEAWQMLFYRVAPILHAAGYKFMVVTEEDIYLQPRFGNLQILQRYWRELITYQMQATVRSYFKAKGNISRLGDALQDLSHKGIGKGSLYALIYWGVLSFDTMKPLNADSMIRIAGMAQNR